MKPGSLAPGLLIATPPLDDPNFAHALILLVHHNSDEGALGLVINGKRQIAYVGDLLEQLDLCEDGSKYREPVRIGGPVQTELGWIVYRPSDEPLEGEIRLSDSCAVTQSREVLASIGRGQGPAGYQALLGYTGWAPGQLEEEIRQGSWLPMSLEPSIVFEVPIDKRWQVAFERAGVTPMAMMTSKRGMA